MVMTPVIRKSPFWAWFLPVQRDSQGNVPCLKTPRKSPRISLDNVRDAVLKGRPALAADEVVPKSISVCTNSSANNPVVRRYFYGHDLHL